MITTEKQASEKWCPMVRAARREEVPVETREGVSLEPVVASGCNTDSLGRNRVPASCCCIASQCAMWRWFSNGMACAGIEPSGYCGLAGKPNG